jgi:hypothetical protein
MTYIIDGHNLIPKIHGLALDEPDDEQRLIEVLQEFCRLRRKQVEVFFDNAPPGGARARSYGSVTARFARSGQSADLLIAQHLACQGRAARNLVVISSDRAVQAAARAAHAASLSSEDFARLLMETLRQPPGTRSDPASGEIIISDAELDEWLGIFGSNDKSK